MDKDKIKMIRLQGESLDLANELIEDFKKKGLRASWTSVVNTSIPLLHAQLHSQQYTVVSNVDLAERRAYDVGTSIAAVLGALCSAKVDMTGCQLGYLPEVDAMGIRLDAVADIILIHAGGADPAMIANVVTEQLRSRGYIQDDGTVFVDMDQILGVKVGASNDE